MRYIVTAYVDVPLNFFVEADNKEEAEARAEELALDFGTADPADDVVVFDRPSVEVYDISEEEEEEE